MVVIAAVEPGVNTTASPWVTPLWPTYVPTWSVRSMTSIPELVSCSML